MRIIDEVKNKKKMKGKWLEGLGKKRIEREVEKKLKMRENEM